MNGNEAEIGRCVVIMEHQIRTAVKGKDLRLLEYLRAELDVVQATASRGMKVVKTPDRWRMVCKCGNKLGENVSASPVCGRCGDRMRMVGI